METPTSQPKYAPVVQLIEAWQQFENEHPGKDLAAFGLWLMQHQRPPQELDTRPYLEFEQAYPTALPERLKEFIPIPIEGRMGFMLGYLQKFSQLYSRPLLNEIGLAGIEEFGFLANLHALGTPNKTELCHASVRELTTGMEFIRRLVKMGLAEEYIDPDDRRSKRVRITAKGEAVAYAAYRQMQQMSIEMFAILDDEEKQQLWRLLTKLHKLHTAQHNMRLGKSSDS
jgi:DNA-binding MarR family transcriptional regulator